MSRSACAHIVDIKAVDVSKVFDDELYEVLKYFLQSDLKEFSDMYDIQISKSQDLYTLLKKKCIPIYFKLNNNQIYVFQLWKYYDNQSDCIKRKISSVIEHFNYYINYIQLDKITGLFENVITYIGDKGTVALDTSEIPLVVSGSDILQNLDKINAINQALGVGIIQNMNEKCIKPYIYIAI